MDASEFAFVLLVLGLVGLVAYDYGKRRTKADYDSKEYRPPNLGQLVVKAKLRVEAQSMGEVASKLMHGIGPNQQGLKSPTTMVSRIPGFLITSAGNLIDLTHPLIQRRGPSIFNKLRTDDQQKYFKKLSETRPGIPIHAQMVGEKQDGDICFDLTIKPALYMKVTQLVDFRKCTEQDIQDAQHECASFANETRGIVEGTWDEEPAAGGSRFPSDVQNELMTFGMTKQAELLSEAEGKIAGGAPPDGVKNCRSALEQVVENLLARMQLDRANSFKNNLLRLVSHKYLDQQLADAIYEFYYRLVSEDAHDKYEAGPKEARYILSMTESAIHFLLDRVG
jgi:hypothetical protein